MYEGDSFFTLSLLGRAGLLMVSLILALLCGLLVARLGRGRRWWLRAALAVGAFWAFVWLSPQLYYFYYMTLFEGLPLQSVIKAPPPPREMIALLIFAEAPNLSNHAKGVLGWALIGFAVWAAGKRCVFTGRHCNRRD